MATCRDFGAFAIVIEACRTSCFICKRRGVDGVLKALLRSHFQGQT